MLYNTFCLSHCFDSSNDKTIRDIANNTKRRMWIYCKLILIRVVCLWISWNEIIYIFRLVSVTFAGWQAHVICWLQWACLHNRPRCLWVEILGVWDASLLCWTDIAVWDWLSGAISKNQGCHTRVPEIWLWSVDSSLIGRDTCSIWSRLAICLGWL